MPGCSTGRNIQKYKGAAASTLQDVTDNGNTTTGDLITTSGYFIGDGSLLTGIAGASSAFSLQDTSDRGNTTSNTIQFTNTQTSFITSGNIFVASNVTATEFYGDGTTLTGVALSTDMTSNASRVTNLETDMTSNASRVTNLETDMTSNASRIGTAETNISSLETDMTSNASRIGTLETDLTSNASRITTVENNVLVSNSSGITSGIGQGDILIGDAANTLTKLTLGADSHVLTSNTSTGKPEWKSASAIGTTVATLSNSSHIIGGSYNGGSAKTWSLKASTGNSADYIVIRDSSGNINVGALNVGGTSLTSTAWSGSAATLTNARDIGGVSFDGSANINLPGVNQGGNQDTSGNAATATKLATARDIGGVSFDGTANINLPGVNQGGNQDTTGKAGSITNASDTTTSSELNVAFLNGNQVKTNTNLTFKPNSNELKLNNLKITGSLTAGNSTGSSGQVLKSTGTGVEWGTDNTGGSGGTTVWTKDTSTNKIYYNTENVGINKTNPAYRLDVGGDINLTGGLYVSGSSGSSGQVLKSDGSGGLSWQTDNTGGSGGTSVWSQSGSTPNFIITTPTPESNVGIATPTGQTVTQTLHIGSNVIVSDTGDHDVLRVNGNVFCTNYLFGDGSKIRNLNTIRTETGGNQISIGGNDGGPVLSWRERQIRYQRGSGRPDPPNYGF